MEISDLPKFIRSVREWQGMSQKEIAQKIRITPSAITQYEKGQASLSMETLLAMAPLLNLNPDFINTKAGNPFKQAKPQTVIKMSMPASKEGDILSWPVLPAILDFNSRVIFAFLQPSDILVKKSMKMRRWQRKGLSTYALIIQDGESNIFLCKRKDGEFFYDREITQEIERENHLHKDSKVFVTQHVSMSDLLYNQIQSGKIDRTMIDLILAPIRINDSRVFLLELLRRMKTMVPEMTKAEYNKMRQMITESGSTSSELMLIEILTDEYKKFKDSYLG